MDMLIYSSVVYFACATAIESITGTPSWVSIISGSAFTILYTCIGGIRTVVWTDVLQALLMLAGILTVTVQAILKVDSLSKIFDICQDWGRTGNLSFSPDPTVRRTVWSVTIGMAFSELNRYGTDQAAVQRYCSVASLTKARLSVLGLIPLIAIASSLTSLSGLAIFAYYAEKGCDPLRGKIIKNPNQLVPHFLKENSNYPGIQGILLVSIIAASLSTASSGLNSSAANVWKDIVCVRWPGLTERWNVIVTKICVVLFGILSTALAFLLKEVGGTLVQMSITIKAAFGGPLTAMFLLGIFFPCSNWIGTAIGNLAGFTFCLWLGIGGYSVNSKEFLPSVVGNCNSSAWMPTLNSTTMVSATGAGGPISDLQPETSILQSLYRVSFLWITCFSTTLTFVVGLLVSLLTGGMGGGKVRPELLHPWVRRLYRGHGHVNQNGKTDSGKELEMQMTFLDNQNKE